MRRRLALAIAGVATLAVVLFAVPLALVLQRVYLDEALLRLQRDTVAATRSIDVAGEPGDAVELPSGGEELTVYDARGRRIAGRNGPERADELVRQALRDESPTARLPGGRLVVAVPLVMGERVTGAVRAERSNSGPTREARARWWLLGLVGLVVVGVATLAAILLGRRLARPLERLAAAARRLGEGDFAVRAPRAGVREVDEVAAALDVSAGRLNHLVTRERAFSADASHQLRTPLAALRVELEAIELRGEPGPEIPAALAQVERLQSTIDTLLTVARDAPRRSTTTRLRALLDDAEARWRGPLAAQGRPLRIRMDDQAAEVRGSASVLREIVDVLLDNATRHGAGAVEVRARRIADTVALDVADEGAELRVEPEAVFERRTGDGHGIGLALARALADAEGGRLALSRTSPPVFTLWLPAANDDSQ